MCNKVLLIDDDVKSTFKLKKYLQSEGFNVCTADNAVVGFNKANSELYQLIIMDIVMPDLYGFALLRALKNTTQSPVLIMTNRDEHFDRIYSLENGADDYLIKPVNNRELLARMKIIIRRTENVQFKELEIIKPLQPENCLNINNIRLNCATREVYCEDNLLHLTGSEFEVLHFLMSNAGKINSKETIGKNVFGRSVSYYDRSIDMHISNIRKKITMFGEKPPIKTVRGIGYTFLSEQNNSEQNGQKHYSFSSSANGY